MADPEQLNIPNQGVEAWNEWREENPDIKPNLNKANLRGANLRGANLIDANLSSANLRWANLSSANLSGANLINANLSSANLIDANLFNTDLRWANLIDANLRWANLSSANLSRADLSRANLSRADLSDANLSGANVNKANLSLATIGYTNIGDIDLSNISGLESTIHHGPSTIGIGTIFRSSGKIPHKFLEDAGVPNIFIEYMESLTGQAFQYYSCFISHSTNDKEFADRICADLRKEGVRCWFAPEDMKIGDKILDSIDRSIRTRDKLLLILSKESIGSEWVEDEVNTAFEEERRRKATMLFPIRLDNSVMDTDEAWAAKLRNRHIGDFTNWKDRNNYLAAFKRLIRDLQTKEQ